jgi:hypothetical protein
MMRTVAPAANRKPRIVADGQQTRQGRQPQQQNQRDGEVAAHFGSTV